MTFARDLSGNNPIDLKYSPYNRTAADLTAVLALAGLYPGEIVEALNTGRKYRWLGSAWGLIGPVTSVVAGTLPQPNVTITQAAGQTDPATVSPILFTAVFSQDVIGFVTGDVSFTGSTAPGTLVGTVSGGPNTYTVSVSGMTGAGTVIASVPAGVATGVGGLNVASAGGDNTVTIAAPDVNVAAAAGQANPTSTTPINFTATFSQPVTGFVTGDVSFASSTAGGALVGTVTGGPSVYNVAVTGMTTNGSVTVSVPAGSATGIGGPNNAGFPGLVNWVAPVVDTTPPAPGTNRALSQADPTNVSPIQFFVSWSEAVVGFNGSDISFAGSTVGGTLTAFVSQTTPTTYDVFVSGMTTNGDVTISIPAGVCTDTSGNPNIASIATDDNVVAWTGGVGGGFPDPQTSANEFPILFV